MRLSYLLLSAGLAALSVPAAAQTAAQPAPAAAAQQGGEVPPSMTLREALAQAYSTSPQLTGQRATLRATDENVPIARAAGRPTLSNANSVTQSVWNSAGDTAYSRQMTAGVDLSVPVYRAGSVSNAVRAAEVRVQAGRAQLRGTETDLFVSVVTAYMDVIQNEAIVRLNQQNVHMLEVNLEATRDRFEVGDLTRTDVAQSEARLALAQSQLRGVEANLIASRESFVNVVGVAPGELAPPPALPNLPDSPQTAVSVALEENPTLEAARHSADATGYDVAVARAGRMPQVSVGASADYYNYLGSLTSAARASGYDNDGLSTSVGVQLSMPLLQGGRVGAQVRQAQARESAAIEQVTATERSVVAQARSAFARYQSSLRVIDSTRVAVQANTLSLEGVRAENSVGTRTILDILNAEQELLNAQVQYVTAQRDAYVAGFTLLSIMGRAEASDIGLDGGALYNPAGNYDRVQGRWFDWGGDDPDPAPVATPTTGTEPQTPDVRGTLDPLLQRPVDSGSPYTSME